MSKLMRRIGHWLSLGRRDADLAEEIEHHRSLRQAALEQAGMTAREAAAASRRDLGNIALAREDARAIWTGPVIERVWQDARYGVRVLRKQPTFAAAAILILAIGTGTTTTLYSVVDAELWRPLPFPDADRLVALYTVGSSASRDRVSAPDLLDWRSQTHAFEQLAGFQWSVRHILRGRDTPEAVRVQPVTSNFFTVLRRTVAHGRPFGPQDEASARSVILTDACWRRLFDRDPQVVGRTIVLDDDAYVVAGVAAPGRLEFMTDPDLFKVLNLNSAGALERSKRDLNVVGRLRDGVGHAVAGADLQIVAQRIADDYPADNKGRGVRLMDLREAYTNWNWRPLFFFLGTAVFVLILSCANVANLLLARALGRQREFAIRSALGGGPRTLVRQLLVEGGLVAFPGAALGVILANWTLELVSTSLPAAYAQRGGQFALDGRVLATALVVAVLTTLVFGLAPALVSVRRDLRGLLTQGARTVSGSLFERRTRHTLVVVEVSMALVLLVAAGLFLNSFLRLTRLPTGFDAQDRLTMRIPVTGARYEDPRNIVGFSERLLEESRSVPGVSDAAIGTDVPLDSGPSASFAVSDQPAPVPGQEPAAITRAVTPEYFRVLGIRVVAGRDFTNLDVDGGLRVALINEHLARRFFPGESAIGKELVFARRGTMAWVKAGSVQIVGVVSNVKDVGMNEVDFNNIYLPFAQSPAPSVQLIVSTAIPPERVADALRRTVHHVDPALPVVGIKTMADRVEGALRGDRFHLMLIGALAVVATLLASIGIYALMAYTIEQRTQEFGLRLALGAGRIGILAIAVRQAAGLGLAGTMVGLALSLVLARMLGNALYLVQREHEGVLYGVRLTDPLTLMSACVVLFTVSCLAGLLPARRATRVDPLTALRAD